MLRLGDDGERRAGDVRRILWAQGVRAFAYGLAALLLGTTLYRLGLTGVQAGAVLAAVAAGSVLSSVAVARAGDRIGRRRMYLILCLLLGASGVIFAYATSWWLFTVAALTGTVSTEVIASGPFASLDQAMLAGEPDRARRLGVFGRYNAVAAAAGSLGALAVGGPGLLRRIWPGFPPNQRFFLVLVVAAVAGAIVATRLSAGVEVAAPSRSGAGGQANRPAGLRRSRRVVAGLASLFALDSFAGGFVLQAFLAYWFAVRFHSSPGQLGLLFFSVGVAQTGSVLIAARLGSRFGLLTTMVASHLPSNLLLAAVPLAPTFLGAAALLVARSTLSQMDVPTRQAYVMALVDPLERTAAVGYMNAARYATRPVGPVLAGAGAAIIPGLPFFVAGGLKT
ncbi:MAG: MFS transporter, partial [Candidatus Dormibacteria bacterium]